MAAEMGADKEKLWADLDHLGYIVSFIHLSCLIQCSDSMI
jgi:hypothetical protein